jgi:molybdate-binding protein
MIDGQEQEGVYLGWGNQTTWGFRYEDAVCRTDGTGTRDYYEVKLMGLPESPDDTAGYEVSFKGFLKVVVW